VTRRPGRTGSEAERTRIRSIGPVTGPDRTGRGTTGRVGFGPPAGGRKGPETPLPSSKNWALASRRPAADPLARRCAAARAWPGGSRSPPEHAAGGCPAVQRLGQATVPGRVRVCRRRPGAAAERPAAVTASDSDSESESG
jgi:hypothetical protein